MKYKTRISKIKADPLHGEGHNPRDFRQGIENARTRLARLREAATDLLEALRKGANVDIEDAMRAMEAVLRGVGEGEE